ncbi:MAG: NUDIX hydrolase [Burkholderiaceae bacterium]|nr:NUDIX hydrolase [Burkholderiaceae bacterium]
MKSLSSGILVLNPHGELLLCHATGTYVWDIPKGGADPGESTLATAIRETAEETGLRFAPEELLDLGHFGYRPSKDLHLYAALRERFDPRQCHCSSHFTDLWGRRRPEMDAYEWIAFERVPRRCARRMAEVLTQRLSLPKLLQQLQQRTAATQSRYEA